MGWPYGSDKEKEQNQSTKQEIRW